MQWAYFGRILAEWWGEERLMSVGGWGTHCEWATAYLLNWDLLYLLACMFISHEFSVFCCYFCNLLPHMNVFTSAGRTVFAIYASQEWRMKWAGNVVYELIYNTFINHTWYSTLSTHSEMRLTLSFSGNIILSSLFGCLALHKNVIPIYLLVCLSANESSPAWM